MKKTTIQASEPTTTYLSFKLNNELFAVDVQKTITILDIKPITVVPNSPAYMRGVINLRGSVLPIVDLGVKLGLNETVIGGKTCIIVLCVKIDGEDVQLGILADTVDEVFEIPDSKIEVSPMIGTKYKVDFIKGMYQLPSSFIMLLNIDIVFNSSEHLFLETDVQQPN